MASCINSVEAELPNVCIQDRKSNSEATVVSFIAEHSLSLRMAPHLIGFAKELARDPVVLNPLSMERPKLTYKLKYGLNTSIHKKLVNDLRSSYFSINLDECPSSNKERVFSGLVSYFSEEDKECVVHHFASLSMTVVNVIDIEAIMYIII